MLKKLFLTAVLTVAVGLFLGCGGNDNPAGNNNSSSNNNGGNSYDIVELGGLKWMTKNLDYQTADSWCYEGKPDNCATYGRLYKWAAAKTACRSIGMRLPTREEWETLVNVAGGNSIAGKTLKSTSGWRSNGNGTDDLGFSALPGGIRYSGGSFSIDANSNGYWWIDSGDDDDVAYYRSMSYLNNNVSESYGLKNMGYSVRCVKN